MEFSHCWNLKPIYLGKGTDCCGEKLSDRSLYLWPAFSEILNQYLGISAAIKLPVVNGWVVQFAYYAIWL